MRVGATKARPVWTVERPQIPPPTEELHWPPVTDVLANIELGINKFKNEIVDFDCNLQRFRRIAGSHGSSEIEKKLPDGDLFASCFSQKQINLELNKASKRDPVEKAQTYQEHPGTLWGPLGAQKAPWISKWTMLDIQIYNGRSEVQQL